MAKLEKLLLAKDNAMVRFNGEIYPSQDWFDRLEDFYVASNTYNLALRKDETYESELKKQETTTREPVEDEGNPLA